MFHRPKTEDKTTDMPAGQNAAGTSTPASSTSAPKMPAPAEAPRASVPPLSSSSPVVKPAAVTPNTTPTASTAATVKPEGKIMSSDEQTKQPSRPLDIPGASSSYQLQPARVPGSAYSPSPYASGPGLNAPGTASSKPVQGRRLVIGEGITLSGEIEACEYLVIEGTVEASLKGASVLEIAQSGTFYGTVEIDEATVAGRFEGEITVNGRLTITATGSVTGTVSYKELAVEAGATLDGKVNPLSGSKAAAIGKKSDKTAKVKGPRNDNDGIELPFSGSQAAIG